MSSFVDHEVEEASEGEDVSDEDDGRGDHVKSKKKSAGKNRSRVIDSSDEDEDDGECGFCFPESGPHSPLMSQMRTS
jgi:hypothetical protein